ncbi:MAG: ATP-binding protein [Syntrophorhabdales bacterium]|jgi:PAS domain S-box-containing protein
MEDARSRIFNGEAELLDAVHEVIIARDPDDRIIFWNRRAEEIYGWSRQEALGKSAHQLLKTVWPKPIEAIMSDLIINGRWEGEQTDSRKDGRQLFIKSHWTLKRDNEGRTSFGGIAHNFNNLLTMILGFAEIAEEDVPESSPAADSIARIVKAAHRGTMLVRDILAFTRERPEGLKLLRVAAEMDESIAVLGAAQPGNIEIATEIKDRDVIVKGSPWDIKQIAVNIGTNAIQAMTEKGGKLSVSLERVAIDSPLRLAFVVLPPGSYARLVFADTGPGIPDSVMDRIFDPFFTRRDPARAKGIGLAVVSGIVRSLKGGISVESQPGRGTKFEVYLPAEPNGEESSRR